MHLMQSQGMRQHLLLDAAEACAQLGMLRISILVLNKIWLRTANIGNAYMLAASHLHL